MKNDKVIGMNTTAGKGFSYVMPERRKGKEMSMDGPDGYINSYREFKEKRVRTKLRLTLLAMERSSKIVIRKLISLRRE